MSQPHENSSSVQCKPFYLNLVLLNKEEVVTNKVAEKTGFKAGGLLGKAAAFAANKLVSDETVLEKLSDGLIDGVNKAITDLNIKATIEFEYKLLTLIQCRSYWLLKVQNLLHHFQLCLLLWNNWEWQIQFLKKWIQRLFQ